MIQTICICGAGTMGSGIAQVAAMGGYRTLLYDVDAAMVDKGRAAIESSLQSLVEKNRIRAEDRQAALSRLTFINNPAECLADLIIEAIVEKPEIKRTLFHQLAAINPATTILASNTSSLSITSLAEQIPHPERVAGMHFFNPAPLMKLVEVVNTKYTNADTTRLVTETVKQMGKTPVLCKDAPGFIVNHVARPYYLEAMKLVEDGRSDVATIDAVLESSGFKMGPFRLMDLIGNDVNYAVSCSVYEAMGRPERLKPSPLQEQKVSEGKLGRKTGEGWYPPPVDKSQHADAQAPPSAGTKGVVVVTGGTGFLGAYIIKELVARGHTVRAIRRNNKLPFYIPPAVFERVEWVQGDILDIVSLEEALEGVDAVIHAAAMVSFSRKDRAQLFNTNIEGTANIVNMALAKNLKRFIHVSSVAALGRAAKGERVAEDKKWEDSKLNTNYAISKFHGEMEVWRGIGEGLPAVIVNPSTILGYGDWDTSSSALFKNSFREFPWYSNGINGFVDVTDTARAVVALMEGTVSGERYILNGDNWSFRQLFNTIAAEFGKKQPSREATPFLSAIAWRLEKVKSLFSGHPSLLTRESARIAQSTTFFQNDKILRQLPGFAFTPLEQTIREACKSYIDHISS